MEGEKQQHVTHAANQLLVVYYRVSALTHKPPWRVLLLPVSTYLTSNCI